tara:strand:+ start:8762 stop:9070 length:309 start_codon:yes stop_codon:yes gene_type:complete
MATEFQVKNVEEFEKLIRLRDFRVYEALVSTVLKNLKSKKHHHHAFSVITEEEDAIYDITINRKDFTQTLQEFLPKYELEEKYEECAKILKALSYLNQGDVK